MKRHRYVGIDQSPRYVQTASKRYPEGRFMEMDGRRMAFSADSFDLAMYIGVLHHMDEETARACMKETSRVLRKNGRVLVAEPIFTKEKWLSSLLLTMDRGRFIRDENGYRALFGELKVIRQRHFSFSLHRFCSFVLEK